MTYPAYVPTRVVSLGGAAGLETSDPLSVKVRVTASRSLVWEATGYRLERVGFDGQSAVGSELQIVLPRTDVAGWRDPALNTLIDVSVPDSYTHRYTAELSFVKANGLTVGSSYTVGPFVVPDGVGVIDLDKTVPVSTLAGDVVLFPDLWGTMVADAAASAAAAEAAVVDSAAFVNTTIETGLTGAAAQAIADTPELSATFAPLREVYVSAFGVVGDATDATIAAETATNNTAALQAAVDACLTEGVITGRLVYDVPGWAMISSRVDTKGVSVRGLDRMRYGIRIDPNAPYSAWQIGGQVNNMLSFGCANKSDYTIEELGFHGSDAYAPTFSGWGGTRITFRRLYVRNSGKCGVQLIGSRREGTDLPIVDSVIEDCIVDDTKWAYVVDGEAYGVSWNNLKARGPVVRAFSLDPLEAESSGKRRQRGFSATNLSSYGRTEAPASWDGHPTPPAADAVFRAKTGLSGTVAGLQGRDFDGAYGLHLDNVALEMTGVQMQIDNGLTAGTVAVEMGTLGGGNGCHITGMFSRYTKGVRAESLTGNTFVEIVANLITTPVEVADLGIGSQIRVAASSTTRAGRIIYDTPSDTLPRTIFDPSRADTGVSPANLNNAYFFPVIGSRDSIARLFFEVTNSVGNIEVGVYANAGEGRSARPATKIATTGLVACPAVGVQSLTLDATVNLDGARHWIGIYFDNASTALLGIAGTEATKASASVWAGRAGKRTSQSGLASTIAGLTLQTNRQFLITGSLI